MLTSSLHILLVASLAIRCGAATGPVQQIQRDKLADLLTIYPPRNPDNSSITLHTKIIVKELMDMSVKTETLKVMAWIRFYWLDYRLAWEPPDYGFVKEIRVPPNDIWTPDMLISNSLSDFEIRKHDRTIPAIIGYNGLVHWSVPFIIETRCNSDVTFFPFDSQECRVKLNSWTYHDKLIKLEISDYSTSMESRLGNIEWVIKDVTNQLLYEPDVLNHPFYPNQTIRYPYIEYRIRLKRKPEFYTNMLIYPSLLLAWLSSLLFLLPNECAEKLSFSITMFLALYVNQMIVADMLPPSADTFPLIARFYTIVSLLMGLSVILTVISLTIHNRLNHEMISEDSWLFKFVEVLENIGLASLSTFLSKIKCHLLDHCPGSQPEPDDFGLTNIQHDNHSDEDDEEGEKRADSNGVRVKKSLKAIVAQKVMAECSSKMDDYLRDIVAKLTIIAKDDAADIALRRWRLIAAGLDKLFFLLYIALLAAVSFYFGALVIEHLSNEQ